MSDQPLTDDVLAELKRLNEARTPGTWSVHYLTYGGFPHPDCILSDVVLCDEDGCDSICEGFPNGGDYDASFIAAAANAMPALLDEIDRLRKKVLDQAYALVYLDLSRPEATPSADDKPNPNPK